ncbi:MAG TPA: cytochrome c oxidase subunit I [Candidatus Limnocylindria bacterium]|nr:cytochrome c oxidase subunit I [Candidatus Limnocylindria bacterium]
MSTVAHVRPQRSAFVDYLTTVDHKRIGIMYLVTAIGFLGLGGVLGLIMRAELSFPGLQVVDEATYNQLFTMHGTGMIFFAIVPLGIGFANYLLPLQIGAPDVAFPRLNALTYWLFLLGGLVAFSGFLTVSGAASFGWYGYPPLSTDTYSPGAGGDLWVMGLILSGTSGILGAVNFIATVFTMRAPGMTMFRIPIFTWNILVTALLIILTFPVLTAALVMLFIERTTGAVFFDPAAGGSSVLWQHLFWFFGHPEVYIMALPFFGVVSEVVPVFSSKRIFGYRALVFATLLIGAYSFSVWAHHMFTTGAVSNVFFAVTSFLIAIPTGVKFFTWIATMWRGRIRFSTPMLFVFGFLFQFLAGGITGVFLASPPIDYQVHDSYYVVAHMHYVLFGGSAFAAFAAFYFWIPKMSGRMLSEGLGKVHFWLLVIGFNLTFFPMHQLGLDGMARRIADYPAETGWSGVNVLISIGAMIIALATLLFIWNVVRSVWMRRGAPAGNDPWGGYSLEWYTSSPPPHHNFTALPAIRSERPTYDARRAAEEVADG